MLPSLPPHRARSLSSFATPDSQAGGAPLSTTETFRLLLSAGCLVAAITHIAFGHLFWQHGVSVMAWANVGSVLVYALSAWLLRRGSLAAAVLLMMAEVTAHALGAVIAVGWESGFHFYLLAVIPIFLANQASPRSVRFGVGLTVSAAYLLLDIQWHHRAATWPLPPQVLSTLHTFNLGATIAILCVFTVLYVHLIAKAEARLHALATTDSLTGLMNRRSMDAALQRLQTLRLRKPQAVTMVLIDIDHFKQLNDSHGHALGDWALQTVADVLEIGVRDVDLLARWGGEEFLIALPDADLDAATQVAERLRQNIAALRFPLKPSLKGGDASEQGITATFGLSALSPDEPVEAAIHRADVALYQGKQGGRNRVVRAP